MLDRLRANWGFLTAPDLSRSPRHLATIARLEKHRGHLYNWYNPNRLNPCSALRFVCRQRELRSGLSTLSRREHSLSPSNPLIAPRLFAGLRTHWQLLRCGWSEDRSSCPLPSAEPRSHAIRMDRLASAADAALAKIDAHSDGRCAATQWSGCGDTAPHCFSIFTLFARHTPWMLHEYESLRDLPELDLGQR